MLCTQCQANEAAIHFEAVINGKKAAAELCSSCAQKNGLTGGVPPSPVNFPSLSPLLADLFGMLSRWNPPPSASACPRCRWTVGHFRRTGKMGCPDCYTHFRHTAQNVLSQIHGSTQHKGRRPRSEAPRPKARDKKEGIADLHLRLERAIRDERFEEAAVLRDRLRALGEKP